MEHTIRNRYHESILEQAGQRYGVSAEQIRPLDAFESYVFAFERNGQELILRLSHSLRRSEEMILGEVDWINYLAEGGVSVARVVPSRQGRLVEAIPDGQGGQFLAAAFVRATGGQPWIVGWTPERYQTYGRLMGSIHALSETYQPSDPAWKRPEWDDSINEVVDRYLPASETKARQIYRSLCDHVQALPRGQDVYGLIHQDAHEANLLMDDAGNLTLFDFDDCVYSWYANDLAIVLFYISIGVEDVQDFTRTFMSDFLRGYRQVYPFESHWLAEFPAFLKMREIELYAIIHRDFDVQSIDDPWIARYMQGRKQRIEADVPTIDFDFTSLENNTCAG